MEAFTYHLEYYFWAYFAVACFLALLAVPAIINWWDEDNWDR